MIQNAANLGFMTNSNGIDNEIEIIGAHDMALQAVTDMKIYVSYYHKGTFRSSRNRKSTLTWTRRVSRS